MCSPQLLKLFDIAIQQKLAEEEQLLKQGMLVATTDITDCFLECDCMLEAQV